MTSRTVDIHCRNCRTYLFSVLDLDKYEYYCKAKKCKEAATVAKLAGVKAKVYKY